MNTTITINEEESIFNRERWGLPEKAIEDLADRLYDIWLRYKNLFSTKTRDSSEHAFVYLKGLLTMDIKRNYANIARRIVSIDDDGQNLQNFMSDSPWSAEAVFERIQQEITEYENLAYGMLTLDESGDKRSGGKSAGASRQYLGRLGKVDVGQVGVVLGYFQENNWMLVDSQLYFPLEWFTDEYQQLRDRWLVPENLCFRTKLEIALSMIQMAKENGLKFSVIGADIYYGKSQEFRIALNEQNFRYMVGITANYKVYTTRPNPYWREPLRRCTRDRILVESDFPSVKVASLVSDVEFSTITVRHCERGLLSYQCASKQIFTVTDEGEVYQETLLIRKETDGKYTFSLSNAPAGTTLHVLLTWRCARYFVERTIQDSKSELGWHELEAMKYRAWMHHSALTALGLWLAAQTKLEFQQQYPQDPFLAEQLQVQLLPSLSVANIRELLKAIFPLPVLSPSEAAQLVVKHLVSRSRSTASRLRSQFIAQQSQGP